MALGRRRRADGRGRCAISDADLDRQLRDATMTPLRRFSLFEVLIVATLVAAATVVLTTRLSAIPTEARTGLDSDTFTCAVSVMW